VRKIVSKKNGQKTTHASQAVSFTHGLASHILSDKTAERRIGDRAGLGSERIPNNVSVLEAD
jgi:hypothetical protein